MFYTVQTGSPRRPTLVLVHGAGGRHTDWPNKVRFLPDTTVYALDLPGHAQSDPPGRTTIEAYAADVEAFIAALELERVVIVGHSMGGAIGQVLALRRTPQVAGLVLVGTSARLRVGDIILDTILPNFRKALDIIFKFAWSQHARPVQVGLAKRLMAENGPQVVHGDFTACHHFDVRDRLGEIVLPTLVISGSEDQMTPPKFGRALATDIPQAQYVEIYRTGHFLMQEAPDLVAAEIKHFVDELAER
jgi:pimeloyl-ACP methyl ester carboxylesterase